MSHKLVLYRPHSKEKRNPKNTLSKNCTFVKEKMTHFDFICTKEYICLKIVQCLIDNVLFNISCWSWSSILCTYWQNSQVPNWLWILSDLWMISLIEKKDKKTELIATPSHTKVFLKLNFTYRHLFKLNFYCKFLFQYWVS